MNAARRKFPEWLKKRLPRPEQLEPVLQTLRELHLTTVCQEARCPNLCECFARGTATFMILGSVCTRRCTFCAVGKGTPSAPDLQEPERVAAAAERLALKHVVVTSVTRDDLPDGGSGHFAKAVRAIRARCSATVEVLTPDFQGRAEDIDRVALSRPDIYNHNVETVPRLYPEVRPQADYGRSLGLLHRVAGKGIVAKSGLMLGLGESEEEILCVLSDLREAGCLAVTLGQYLQPTPQHHPVEEFVPPEKFACLREAALRMGFEGVASGPFVRSSYNAGLMAAQVL